MRKLGSFIAVDADGNQYTIHKFKKSQKVSSGEMIPVGTWILKTDDGRLVSYKGKGQYEILTNGLSIPISSSDPDAP